MGNSRSSSTSLHHTKEHLEPQILHSYQKIIMRTVWRHMAQGGHASSGATVLNRLIIKEPKVKNVFHHTAVITRMGKSTKNDSQSQTRTCSLNDHQSEIVRFMQYGFIERDSLVSLIPPRPILKSSPSRTEDLNGILSRKSSMRHKESVRFNKNRKSDEEMEDEDGTDYGRARAGNDGNIASND
ncbi:hypothetical protein PRIPAC_84232 [Pristionchus pacificus]|uniref:Uncharacterized protein n=1 Tax=Pristionchus pacificus TaxID=54126 RepID=A0A2A6CC59_PRIPA|nr:hypothetical protein PRIPAC_84232 [Pristionchus pacificus]|eukprot:PDM75690.1 hypothetical protein PRIPAC_43826 [Pristionchus pacificus]